MGESTNIPVLCSKHTKGAEMKDRTLKGNVEIAGAYFGG